IDAKTLSRRLLFLMQKEETMRQPMKANVSLIAALTSASLLAACNSGGDETAATVQPSANSTPVAQAYVTPPRLCAPGPGDQGELGVNGAIPAAVMVDALLSTEALQGYWRRTTHAPEHTRFGGGVVGTVQNKTSGAGRCEYPSPRDGVPGSAEVILGCIVVFG